MSNEEYKFESMTPSDWIIQNYDRVKFMNIGGEWYNNSYRLRSVSPTSGKPPSVNGFAVVSSDGAVTRNGTHNYRSCIAFAFCI
jgi:hypothetical protein